MPSFTSLITLLSLGATTALAGVIARDDSATGVTHTGDITYYNTENGVGACGSTLSDSDSICALSTTLYDEFTNGGDPNNNSLCGKKIQITMSGGATAEVTVADRCAACSMWDLDLTPTVFDSLVSDGESVGRTTASWQFVS
ncbi:expansin-related [Cryphonectria parasitica EP155]|uniref:Expansin-related n=1 Tax=Cryphonectria parasitica (strain ATCC 38755 / EP155) TaxID=660469 RepID=A0A9P4Y347_CRYP1|nr:expansin-related [Cryphonectria parasitica EP155]KAF3765614.1 expansin-related [Cryphonectria parasitica EP155]